MDNFFALIIGIGDDLPETVRDASALRDVLVSNGIVGYPQGNVRFLVEQNSSKDCVLSAFDEMAILVDKADAPTVFIYYSGHGSKYGDDENSQYYLKTYGADFSRKEETMLNGNLFSEKVNRLDAKRIFVMLDCCHAGGVAGFSHTPLQKKLKEGKSKVILSSCADGEKSYILPGAKNSLFTEVAVELLNGLTLPHDMYISAINLIHYVLIEVPERLKAAKYKQKQNPLLSEAHLLNAEYFLCRNANYRDLPEGTEGIQTELIDPLLNKMGMIVRRARDEFEPHAEQDLGAVDTFFLDNEFDADLIPVKLKKDLLAGMGGVRNFNKMKNHFGSKKILLDNTENDLTSASVWNALVSKADEMEKMNFINDYKYRV